MKANIILLVNFCSSELRYGSDAHSILNCCFSMHLLRILALLLTFAGFTGIGFWGLRALYFLIEDADLTTWEILLHKVGWLALAVTVGLGLLALGSLMVLASSARGFPL